MKKNKIILACGFVFTVLLTASCTKERGKEVALETTSFTGTSSLQVFNAVVGSSRNYIYVDAVPVTGAAVGYATPFPATPADFTLNAGFRQFLIKDTLAATTQFPLSFGLDLQAGGNYTLFTYDTITTAKQKIVKNNIVIPTDTTARLRFANFIYNPTALPSGFDIYSTKRGVIFSNVRETEVTEYIPYASALTDTFYIRLTGNGSNLQNVDSMGRTVSLNIQAVLNPTRLRSYTLVFRGGYRTSFNKTNAGAALTNARGLTTFANY